MKAALLRHQDFMKLWIGQTVSEFGSEVTSVALPLTAALFLHATPTQMGFIGALTTLPFLVMSLLAGVYIDRLRRRPLLILADSVRLMLLGLVPVLWVTHQLHMNDLYGVAFLVGCMTVLFDLAYQSYLPSLISRDVLMDGNAKLETTRAASQVAGPGLGGVLVRTMAAPLALGFDSLSYGVSVASLLGIRVREPKPQRVVTRHIGGEIREGLAFVFGNRLIWSIAGCTGTSNFFGALSGSVYVLYFIHGLHFRGAWIGAVYGLGAVGGLVGAVVANRITQSLGLGRTLFLSIAVVAGAGFLVPLAPQEFFVGMGFLILSQALTGGGSVIYNINQVSLRQSLTPDRLLGRMNASVRFLIWGTMPLGSLAGGLLGSLLGLHATLWIGAVGGTVALIWIGTSPVLHLQSAPPAMSSEPSSVS